MISVVAHHEIHARGDDLAVNCVRLGREVTVTGPALDIGLFEADAVDQDVVVADQKVVEGQPDNALDVVATGIDWALENDDVAPLGIVQPVVDLGGDQEVVVAEGGRHREPHHVHGLDRGGGQQVEP